MSEQKIREKLARLCAELDRQAAAAGPIAVTGALVLSAGMAMTACGDDVEFVGQGGSAAAAAYGGNAQTVYGVGGSAAWGGNSTLYGVGGNVEGGGGTGGTAGTGGVGGVYGVGGGGQGGEAGGGGQAGAGGG